MDAADKQNSAMESQWDMLLVNARIATMAQPRDWGAIEGGAIGIKDGRIAWVGAESQLPGVPEALSPDVIDCSQAWVTPGLIDCHSQLVYAGENAHPAEQIAALTDAASEDELLAVSTPRLVGLLKEGVTTAEITTGYGSEELGLKLLRVARRLEEICPAHVYTTFVTADALPQGYADKDAYLAALVQEIIPGFAASKLADAVTVSSALGFPAAELEKIYDAAVAAGLLVRPQAAQLGEHAQLIAKYRPVSASHLEAADEDAVKAMAASGMVAVVLPAAYYTAQGNFDPHVKLIREHGVNMALATGLNPVTSPCASLLLALNMGYHLFALSPQEAVHGVTSYAARALGIVEHAGTIEPGKMADLALWAVNHPEQLVVQLGSNPCLGVIKGGVLRRVR